MKQIWDYHQGSSGEEWPQGLFTIMDAEWLYILPTGLNTHSYVLQ